MDVNSALSSAVTGIHRGLQGLDDNADAVARASTGDGGDVVTPLVESKLNQLQVEASAKMVKSVDEAVGSLLDEMA